MSLFVLENFSSVLIGLKENHDYEKITIRLLVEKMKENLGSEEEPYSRTNMKKKLIDRYVVEVTFPEILGTETIVK